MNDQTGGNPRIQASRLVVGYHGSPVVAGIDFELRAGQSMALIGVNGSGKTTLLRTIAGLQPPVSGALEVLSLPPGASKGRVAYLSQFHPSGMVLPLCVVDIVRMARYPARGLLGRITEADEALVFDAMKIMGIEHLADTPLRSLSGGQQQRVHVAHALAHRADVLLLDEPASGLDIAGRELHLQAMHAELERGASIITATHDIQRTLDYDWVMLLARRVVAIGPAREVMRPDILLEAFGSAPIVHSQHASVGRTVDELGSTVSERLFSDIADSGKSG
jgi:ABC-type Mn2+/Zn2+ transport system ATPase subunit